MYRHNIKVRRQRNFMILLLTSIILLVTAVFGWIVVRTDANKTTKTTDAAPIVSSIAAAPEAKLHIDEGLFKFDLPTDWKLVRKTDKPYRYWLWQSTKRNFDDKTIELYVDGPPPNYAVNRLLPLTVDGQGFSLGAVSDNCSNFTPDAADALKKNQTRPSRWNGVSFICDIPNYNNEAIGTGSLDGINKIIMSGPQSGRHDYYFIYVDHNSHPDQSIFTNALTSFQVK